MANKLNFIFLIITLISVTVLGILVFGSHSPNPMLMKIFGLICFIEIFDNALCVLIELNKRL